MAETPVFWIVAGANGSGKSTIFEGLTVQESKGAIWLINPDLLSKRISEHEHLPLDPEANLEAVKRIETWLEASIRAHQTVGVETVLSTGKYRRLVELAHTHGHVVRLLYVVLESVDLNIERVAMRVAKGGHSVPEARIRERRMRSFEQLQWFFKHADQVDIFDNSGAAPTHIARKNESLVEVFGRPLPEVLTAIQMTVPGVGKFGIFPGDK